MAAAGNRLGWSALPLSLLGAIHALSFAPWALWWLQILAMACALALMLRSGWPTARQMWWFGLGSFVAGLCWMFISMHRFGGMPAPLAAMAVVLLSAFLSIYGAGAIALTRLALRRHGSPGQIKPWLLAGVFGGCWALMEVARGIVFTGFPWLSVGYAHLDGPYSGWAPIVGVYGISALAAFTAAMFSTLVLPEHSKNSLSQDQQTRDDPSLSVARVIRLASLPALLAAIGLGLNQVPWAQPSGDKIKVRLMQGNVPQAMKFNPQRARQAIDDYIAMVRASDAALNLAPETAWTVPLSRTPRPALQKLLGHLKEKNSLFAVGIPLRARPSGLTNSVLTINSTGKTINRYDKRHLVPFGEFIPPGFQWFINLMQVPLGTFSRGDMHQPLLQIAGQKVGFNICYEDLFGEELAVQARDGATILANVSNLGWFGDSHALPQHLNLSRMRSAELRRPMLRATNTGVTAHIDHRGKVIDQLGHFEAAAIDVQVQGYTGLTPYARAGLWAPLALALIMALPGAMFGRAARPEHREN